MAIKRQWIYFLCFDCLACMALGCERRDYADLCPKGWKTVRDECWAPLSYTGPCGIIAKLGELTESMKQSFESRCAVQWPCEEKCEGDYSVDCPLGWLNMGSGLCEAPLEYSQNCLKRVRMVNEGFKREFEIACGVAWPCKKTCDEDFGEKCPSAWHISEDGVCEATPQSYFGTCPPFADLTGFTHEDKKLFGALCDVAFPCATSAPASTCESVDTPCPSGWELKGSLIKVCVGRDYQGPCRPLVKLEDLAMIGKRVYMETCDVTWPCKATVESTSIGEAQQQSRVHSGPVDTDGVVIAAEGLQS